MEALLSFVFTALLRGFQVQKGFIHIPAHYIINTWAMERKGLSAGERYQRSLGMPWIEPEALATEAGRASHRLGQAESLFINV